MSLVAYNKVRYRTYQSSSSRRGLEGSKKKSGKEEMVKVKTGSSEVLKMINIHKVTK